MSGPDQLEIRPILSPAKYDRVTIALHWIVAIVVLSQWLGGQTIDWFAKGDARVAARSFHILFGALLAITVLSRILWRMSYGTRLPPAAGGIAGAAATAMHYLLYLSLITVLTFGIYSTILRGDSIFGLFHIPSIGNYSVADRHSAANKSVSWHGLLANFILILAGIHAGSALVHHYFFRGKILHRMRP